MNERKRDIPDYTPLLIGDAALYGMQSGIYGKTMPTEIVCLGKSVL